MKSNNTSGSSNDADARGAGRDRGRSERGGRSGAGRTGHREARMAITAHVGDGVPVLRYGPDNNFSKFKEKLSTAVIEKYGDLGRLVETGEYYEPPEPDISDFDLDNDPYGVNAADFKDQKREYRKKMDEMESNKSKLYEHGVNGRAQTSRGL